MKAVPVQPCDVLKMERGRALTAVTLRFKAAGRRFPLAHKGLFAIIDQAIVSGTAFFTVVIIGRMTSPSYLGLYYLLLSIVLIVSGIQEQVIASPYVVYSKRRRGRELAEYAGSMWAHHLVLSVLATGGLMVAIVLCSATGNTEILSGLWALLGAGPLLLLRDGIRRFAFANLQLKSVIFLDAIVAVVQLGGLVLVGKFGQLSLFGIYAVMGGACGLACLTCYLLYPPCLRFVPGRLLSDWRQNWGFGKWALRSFLVGNTTPQVMLWILSLAAGAAAAGALGACTTLIGMANPIQLGISNVLTPQAAHAFVTGGAKDLRHVLSRTAAFLGLALGGFCLLVLLTGNWLAVLVYGSLYAGHRLLLFALALSMLMNGLGLVAGSGLWAIDQPRSNFVADICGMSVTLIAAAFLILPFGALGAALAILAGTSSAAVIRAITLIRHFEGGTLVSGLVDDAQAYPQFAAGHPAPVPARMVFQDKDWPDAR